MGPQPWSYTPSYFCTRRGDGVPDGHIYSHTFSFPSSPMISEQTGHEQEVLAGPVAWGWKGLSWAWLGDPPTPQLGSLQDVLGVWRQVLGETSWGHRGPRPA